MPKDRTLALEIDGELRSIILTEEEWLSVTRGDFVQKEAEGSDGEESFVYVYRFNPPHYKANSIVVEYDDGGVCFVGTLTDAHVYSLSDLN